MSLTKFSKNTAGHVIQLILVAIAAVLLYVLLTLSIHHQFRQAQLDLAIKNLNRFSASLNRQLSSEAILNTLLTYFGPESFSLLSTRSDDEVLVHVSPLRKKNFSGVDSGGHQLQKVLLSLTEVNSIYISEIDQSLQDDKIYIIYELDEIISESEAVLTTTYLILSAAMLLMLLFGFMVSRAGNGRRINTLVEVTRAANNGFYNSRARLSGNDSLAKLGSQIDILLARYSEDERRLSVSEHKLSKAQEVAGFIAWEWNPDKDIVGFYGDFASVLEVETKLVPKSFSALGHFVYKPDLDKFLARFINPNEVPESFSVELRLVTGMGNIVWLHFQGGRSPDNSNRYTGIIHNITGFKQIERELERSGKELKYQQNAIDSHCVVATLDPGGRYLHVNSRFCELTELNLADVIGRTEQELMLHKRDKVSNIKPRVQQITSGEIWRGEESIETKTGKIKWLQTTIVPHRDEGGDIDRYYHISTDITDKKNAFSVLLDEQAQLAAINSILNTYLNAQDVGKVFRLVLDKLIDLSQSDSALIVEVVENVSGVHTYVQLAARNMNAEKVDIEILSVLRSGRVAIENESSKNVAEEQDLCRMILPLNIETRTVGVLCIQSRNVSFGYEFVRRIQPVLKVVARVIDLLKMARSRDVASNKLLQEKEYLRAIMDNTGDVLIVSDISGKISLLNRGAKDFITKLNLADSSARSLQEWFAILSHSECSNDLGVDFDSFVNEIIVGNFKKSREFLVTQGDERRIVSLSGSIIVDSSGAGNAIVYSAKDITEERYYLHQIENAQRMESIGLLVASIAGDFNKVVSRQHGQIKQLLDYPGVEDGDGRIKSGLYSLLCQTESASELVSQLLAYSSPVMPGGKKYTKLNTLVEDVLCLVESGFPDSLSLSLYKNSEDMYVLVDGVQIKQALMNILANCLRTANGGQTDIVIETGKYEPGGISTCDTCGGWLDSGMYYIAIRCNHRIKVNTVGINSYRSKTDSSIAHMDSRLSMVVTNNIVHQNHGHVKTNRGTGTGSETTLYFPMVEQLEETKVNKKRRHDGMKVVIVDDESAICQFLSEMLKLNNFNPVVFTSSREAMNYILDNRENVDVVITDQTMPDLTGFELSQNILKVAPAIPIILSTGYSDQVSEQDCMDAGIRKYLMKPVRADQLLDAIDQVIDE